MNGTVGRKPLTAPALVTVAIFALVTAACSNAAGRSSASSGGGNTDSDHGQAVQFAQCMRDNGVKDFPDPDASGTLTIEDVSNRTSIDTDSAAFERAITACKNFEPAGFTGFSRTPEQQQAALKYAQCMRDHGVEDFPDPAIDEPLVDTNKIPSANRKGGMAILNAAMGECGAFAGDAGVTDGK